MANVFVKPQKLVNQGLGLLLRELVLPRFVKRYGKADFVGTLNDTIDIKIPSLLKGREYEFRTRENAIIVDDLNETKISTRLNRHLYNAIGLTDEELTLDITDWGEQVARPQVRAVAEKLESLIAEVMETAPLKHAVTYAPDLGDPDDRSFHRAAIQARGHLNRENVPAAGRVIALGSNVEEAALESKHLVDVDTSGMDETLREAVIGRVSGFTVLGNINSIDPDFAIAMHPTAFALANVAPEVPEGAGAGGTGTFESFALRWIRDYDSDHLRDRSVYSSFAGTQSVDDARDLDPDSSAFGELTDENVRAVEIEFAGS